MESGANNIAYIDGQNLHMGTSKTDPRWDIDLSRLKVYLERKYKVKTIYYYLGCVIDENQDLYEEIQKAGFILMFREHNSLMLGKKKGNVDSDIIFSIMKRLYKKEDFHKIILVSGDGDYKQLVDFLIEEDKFEKILFPNRKHRSSLYKTLHPKFFDNLGNEDIRNKIESTKRKGLLR